MKTSLLTAIKKAALQNEALGCGISGSGPSIFALSKSIETAEKVAKAMRETYIEFDIPFEIHVSKVNEIGVKTLN